MIRFTRETLLAHPETYKLVEEGRTKKFFSWIIDAKYRRAVQLSTWVDEQIMNPSKEIVALARSFTQASDPLECDETMREILNYAISHLKYVPDDKDYWQSAELTTHLLTGDCEDGATMQYVLARLAGVPAERLLLWAGSVYDPDDNSTSGHCCLVYRPDYYPLNFWFMDWCYFPNQNFLDRPTYSLLGRRASCDNYSSCNANPRYINVYEEMWFCFNESASWTEISFKDSNVLAESK